MRTVLAIAALALLPAVANAKDVASQERITCSIAAALKFRLAPELVLAVAEMEGGKPGQWVRNDNNSHDVGPMQFNTKYLAHLEKRYGIRATDVAAAGCYPFELAAWRLRRHIDRDKGDFWTRAANYHSRAPTQNAKYRRKLIAKAAAWKLRLGGERAASHRTARAARVDRDDRRGSEVTTEEQPFERELLRQLDVPAATESSRSKGRPHEGALLDAVRVPPHPAYTVLNSNRAWGSGTAVRWLVEAFDAISRQGRTPLVQIHDMSLREGGPMRGHRSHQSGRDVDITYFHRSCRRACGQRRLGPDELDAITQWKLLQHWIERGQLEFAFVDYALQKPLHTAAKKAGATSAELARWFQYPRGEKAAAGIVRHVPNHADHVHVRFRCASDDTECVGRTYPQEGPVSENDGIEAALLELLE